MASCLGKPTEMTMDIICRHCGEPWDNDELHVDHISYKEAFKLFRTYGCGAMDAIMGYDDPRDVHTCGNAPIRDMSELGELLGDCDFAEDMASLGDLADHLGL